MIKKRYLLLVAIILVSYYPLQAQHVGTVDDVMGRKNNVITTTVPFLLIAPDSRSGAMGDAGVATTPDAYLAHWNPAKAVFAKNDLGIAISYSPWLRNLISDMDLAYLSGYTKLDKKGENAITASLLYFDLGKIEVRTEDGASHGDFSPNEFAIDFGYNRLLGKNFAGAVAFRFINSNLTGGKRLGNEETHPGRSFAADVAFYYHNPNLYTAGLKTTLMFGVNISNIGQKISYTSNDYRYHIPTNFRIGAGYLLELDAHNDIMLTCDFNKLLVPTPAIYEHNEATGENILVSGKDPDVSVAAALFSSWADAPGDYFDNSVLKEELAEFTTSIGFEYWYDKQFALRAGYFHENTYKGNRKFVTFGVGLKMNVFGLDFSYLLPVTQANPLQNTLRFSLIFDIAGLSNEASSKPTNTRARY